MHAGGCLWDRSQEWEAGGAGQRKPKKRPGAAVSIFVASLGRVH